MSTNGILKWIAGKLTVFLAAPLFAAGNLDPTFGNGGKVTTDFPGQNVARASVIQPDGKIVAGGSTLSGDAFLLARYNQDGSLDPTFGSGGKVVTAFSQSTLGSGIYALALQPDGKIVAVGGDPTSSTDDFRVARYNSNGSLDPSFGTGGIVTTDFGAGESANAVALQSDGKIVVAGSGGNGSLFGGNNFVLARYNPNGSLDSTFGTGGKVTTTSGVTTGANALVIQADGKIIAAGGSSNDFVLIRYVANGSPDNGFGSAGRVTTDFGMTEVARALAIQPNGQILAAGPTSVTNSNNTTTSTGFAIARYNSSDGALDSTFDGDGKMTSDSPSCNTIVLQPDGKIVLAGGSEFNAINSTSVRLTRLNSNGSLDSTFGTNGKVTTDLLDRDDANAVVLQSDGKLVAVGFADALQPGFLDTSRLSYFALVRYGTNGALDPSFGTGGKVLTEFLFDLDSVSAIAIQPDGKIVAVGENYRGLRTELDTPLLLSDDFRLARYNPDGSLDPTFGNGGRVKTDFGSGEEAVAVALQADGKIVVVGKTITHFGFTMFGFLTARYNSDGSLDTGFGNGGKVVEFEGVLTLALAVAIQADGKIVVAGTHIDDFTIIRYHTDGSRDSGFGSGGLVTTDFAGGGDRARTLLIQPDGKIVALGTATIGGERRFGLARYNSDGSLDNSFGAGGKVADYAGEAYGAALQRDAKIVVVGHDNGVTFDFALRRYNANGSLDTGFGNNGTTVTDFSGDDEAFAVAIQLDGKIVVAGGKDLFGTAEDFALARYTSSGILDSDFGVGGKLTIDFGSNFEGAQAIALQTDGRIVVGGWTRTVSQDFALARLTFPPSQLLNIATRMRVQTGENVLIGGFIITGSDPKKVIIRGIGPSLSNFFTGVLANPTLELYQGNTLLQSNDDWRTDQPAEIIATGIPPTNDFESAIVRTVAPGAYTAVLRGSGNSGGIGVVEAYDLNQVANSKLANIATRGFVETGNGVMIGGLIIGPGGGLNSKVVVRAIGPSLSAFGIAGAVQDPTLDLVDANGVILRSNDDWKLGGQQAELIALGLQPSDDREAALIETVATGAYTAIVRGSGNITGVALVEVYNVP